MRGFGCWAVCFGQVWLSRYSPPPPPPCIYWGGGGGGGTLFCNTNDPPEHSNTRKYWGDRFQHPQWSNVKTAWQVETLGAGTCPGVNAEHSRRGDSRRNPHCSLCWRDTAVVEAETSSVVCCQSECEFSCVHSAGLVRDTNSCCWIS